MTEPNNSPKPARSITRLFQFTVEVWIDPDRYLEESPAAGDARGARAALRSEILSNLQSLPGVFHASVVSHEPSEPK
jgi:hypothetical protein